MPNDFRLDIEELDILTLDGEPETPVVPTDEIWYNYFGLLNENICTQFVKISAPDLEHTQRGYPRANGLYTETAQWRNNHIKIAGTIQAADRVALETLMDTMKLALAKFGATMRISWAGVTRYYDNCYPVNISSIFDARDHYHIDWCPFEIEFVSEQPFARSDNRVITDAPYPITTTPTNFIIANAGTAPTEPIIIMTVITAGTLSQINLLNVTNNDAITIADSFSDGDFIEINGEEKTVKINGVEVDYTGVIPSAVPGNNIFTATMTGGSFSVSFAEQHYSRYL